MKKLLGHACAIALLTSACGTTVSLSGGNDMAGSSTGGPSSSSSSSSSSSGSATSSSSSSSGSSGGACDAKVLFDSPTTIQGLAVDDAFLYYVVGGAKPYVARIPKEGGAEQPLSNTGAGSAEIIVVGDYVYFSGADGKDGGLAAVVKTGGNPTILFNDGPVYGLTSNDHGKIVFAARTATNLFDLYQTNEQTTPDQPVIKLASSISMFQAPDFTVALRADLDDAFWVQTPPMGGSTMKLNATAFVNPGGGVVLSGTFVAGRDQLAVDSTGLTYFAPTKDDHGVATVGVFHHDSATMTEELLGQSYTHLQAVVAEAGTAYWMECSPPHECVLQRGGKAGVSTPWVALDRSTATSLRLDDKYVYWIEDSKAIARACR